jgi:dephospho-CoA kinase
MDKLIVVTSTQTQQIKRLKDRDGTIPEEALRMLSSQIPLKKKAELADFVVQNEGSLEETKKRAKEIFKELKKIGLQTKERR